MVYRYSLDRSPEAPSLDWNYGRCCWAFAAGMMMGISPRAGDLGLNTLVTVIVFAARGVHTPMGALYTGLLVLAGGCIQTLMALLFWPLRRSKPQMLALGYTFRQLGVEVNPELEPALTPIRGAIDPLEETLGALGSDRSVEGDRFRLLFDQADRLRLSIYLVKRLRDELGEDDSQQSEVQGDAADDLDHFLKGAAKLLTSVGDLLLTEKRPADFDSQRKELVDLVDRAQRRKHDVALKLGGKIAAALDVVVGQLRLVVQLANNTTEEGEKEFAERAEAKPSKLRPNSWRATVKANLNWTSPVFRHALRLSLCIAVADAIQRGIGWQRSYWIPMTVAVVLKPDFTTTFSRGALRLGGTIVGLIVATAVYLVLPVSGWTQLLMVGVFTFFVRYLGPANYGIFTVAMSGLIVFLLAATGISPRDVVATRAANTIVGGLLALAAYAIWPTWERLTVSDSLASMVDAMRQYFRVVAMEITGGRQGVDEERLHWRLKKTAADVAVSRVAAEPGNSKAKIDCLHSIMASSYALVDAVMGMEAGLLNNTPKETPEAFRTFAKDVDFTLYYLGQALHGSTFANTNLPQLREDHRRLLESRDSFSELDEYVLIETDRLTVSLNTLREQVARYVTGC